LAIRLPVVLDAHVRKLVCNLQLLSLQGLGVSPAARGNRRFVALSDTRRLTRLHRVMRRFDSLRSRLLSSWSTDQPCKPGQRESDWVDALIAHLGVDEDLLFAEIVWGGGRGAIVAVLVACLGRGLGPIPGEVRTQCRLEAKARCHSWAHAKQALAFVANRRPPTGARQQAEKETLIAKPQKRNGRVTESTCRESNSAYAHAHAYAQALGAIRTAHEP